MLKLCTGEIAGEMDGIDGEIFAIDGESEGIDGEIDDSDGAGSSGTFMLPLLPLDAIGTVVATDDDLKTGMRGAGGLGEGTR